jgi:PAS domain S-box-containing protein
MNAGGSAPSGRRRRPSRRGTGRRRYDDQRTLLESAERIAQMGSWEWTPETDEVRWSDNAFRLVGLEPGSVTPSIELVVELTHPADRARQAREVAELRAGVRHPHLEYRIVRSDGAVRRFRAVLASAEGAGGTRTILGTVQDVTDQRRAERQIAAHIAVSQTLSEWESFDPGLETLLGRLAVALDCVAGALWIVDGQTLIARSFWSAPGLENAAAFEAATYRLRLGSGERLPGLVWRDGVPVATELAEHGNFLRRKEAEGAGLRGALAFPLLVGEETLGVVELYSQDTADHSNELQHSLVGISHELGQFLGQRRGEFGRPPLTPRELEVLQLAAHGESRSGIADELTISPATVKSHFEHIYDKLGVSGRAAAVGRAMREGLIE